MRRADRRFAQALCAVIALALFGCAAGKPKPEALPTPKPPDDPWSWMPQDAAFLGRADLDALRKTAFWPLWNQLQPAPEQAGWVDLAKVARVTFAGRGHTREDVSYIAALEGSFGEAELRELAARDQLAPEPRGLLTLYRRPDGVWTQISPGLIVTGSPDRLEQLVARASAGPGALIESTPLYMSLASKVELARAHVTLLAEDPDGQGRAMVARQANRYGFGDVTREATRVGIGLELGADYRLAAVAQAADAARAQALEVQVREAINGLANNFLVRMLGFGGLLAQLRVADDGSYVIVRGVFPEVELSELLRRMQGAFSLAGAGGVEAP